MESFIKTFEPNIQIFTDALKFVSIFQKDFSPELKIYCSKNINQMSVFQLELFISSINLQHFSVFQTKMTELVFHLQYRLKEYICWHFVQGMEVNDATEQNRK